VAASNYVQTNDPRLTDARSPTAGSANYIQNGTSQQATSNFNISGNGTAGGTISATAVGIGTTSPIAQFHVKGASPRILGDPATLSGSEYVDFMAHSSFYNSELGGMRIQRQPSSGDIDTIFLAASAGGSAIERMRVTGKGFVGINTSTPSKGILEINGSPVSTSFPAGGTLMGYNGFVTDHGSTSVNLSLYASGGVAAVNFLGFSDERMKRIAGRSDAAQDLATLASIEVTDYTYIDTLAHGTDRQKKVIAQQVQAVYPQAVHLTTDVVPDIYRKAEIKDGWVLLATNLKKGERVHLIGMKKDGIHEVLEVAPGKFRADFTPDGSSVFVYGREVKDFGNVDYEALAMLNVSATQELNRRLEKQSKELAAQTAEITALKLQLTRMARLAEEQASLLAQAMGRLGGSSEIAKLAVGQ